MRINSEHFQILENILATIPDDRLRAAADRSRRAGITFERFAWDAWWVAQAGTGFKMWPEYNDSHFSTAFKRILHRRGIEGW
jgi:hypothetical protein